MSQAENHQADPPGAAFPEAGQELTFEQAMERLELVVQSLEAEGLPLEKLLERYAQAVALARVCQQKLNEAELHVRQLEQNLAGDPVLSSLTLPEEEP